MLVREKKKGSIALLRLTSKSVCIRFCQYAKFTIFVWWRPNRARYPIERARWCRVLNYSLLHAHWIISETYFFSPPFNFYNKQNDKLLSALGLFIYTWEINACQRIFSSYFFSIYSLDADQIRHRTHTRDNDGRLIEAIIRRRRKRIKILFIEAPRRSASAASELLRSPRRGHHRSRTDCWGELYARQQF